jgi:hypothetical protein
MSHRAVAVVAALLALAALPTTVSAGWSTPLRVSPRPLSDGALAVDASGHRHVVARGTDGLWYLTDRGGSWTERRLTRDGPDVDGERASAHHPDIDIDAADGSFVVAWVLSKPAGTGGCDAEARYRTLRNGSWSTTRAIPTPSCAAAVDLEVRGGRITAAVSLSQLEYQRIAVVSGRPGHWSTTFLGDIPTAQPVPVPFAEDPALELDAAGHPSVAFERGSRMPGANQTTVRWAHHIAGRPGLTSERIRRYVGDWPDLLAVDLALDGKGRPRVAWVGPDGTWVAMRGGAGWTSTQVTDSGSDVAITVDAAGRTVVAVAMGTDGLQVFRRAAAGWSRTAVVDDGRVFSILGLVRGPGGTMHLAWVRGWPHGIQHTWVARLG